MNNDIYISIVTAGREDTEEARVVRILPADIMRAERSTGEKTSDNPSLEFTLQLAYSAAKRNSFAGTDFEAWADTVLALEPVESPKAQLPQK
jgi:hypothetical protein